MPEYRHRLICDHPLKPAITAKWAYLLLTPPDLITMLPFIKYAGIKRNVCNHVIVKYHGPLSLFDSTGYAQVIVRRLLQLHKQFVCNKDGKSSS